MWYPRSVQTFTESDTTGSKTITADSTAHTKGAWVDVLSATAFEGFHLEVSVENTRASNTDTSALADIGIDAAGGTSYTVLVPNILIGHAKETEGARGFQIPVYIPTGSTVAARTQSIVTSDTALIGVVLHGGVPADNPLPAHGLVVDYGTTIASSSGTTPANASLHTKGAWVELTSATTHPHRGLSVAVQGSDDVMGTRRHLFDIATGAATSEVVLIENMYVESSGGEIVTSYLPVAGMFQRPIAEGTRLAVRSQANVTNGNDDLDVAVYGWG